MRFIYIFVLLFSQISYAKLVVNNVQGASNFSIDTKGNTTIFGGTSSAEIDTSTECSIQDAPDDGLIDTCNSCANSLKSCNTKRISDLLILNITFFVDSAPAEGPVLVTTEQGIEIEQSLNREIQQAGPNQAINAYLDWSSLCEKTVNGSQFCNETSGELVIKVGIDSNEDGRISTEEGGFITIKIQNPNQNTDANLSSLDCTKAGICDFKVFSGNQKAFIGELERGTGFPRWEGSTFNKLKVFYSSESFQQVTPLSQSIEFSTSANAATETEHIIGSLNNNSQYYFRIAVVDEANNIAFITSDEKIQNTCASTTTLTASQCDSCPYCTRPANVIGILKKDLNCFITTATYGSNQAPLVKLFRQFRNKILLNFKQGIWLTKQYYKWGPQASLVINKHPVLKTFVKLLLTPLAIIAWLSLHINYFLFLLISLFTLFILIFLFKNKKNFSLLSLLIMGVLLNYPEQNLKAKTFTYKKQKRLSKVKKSLSKYEFYTLQVGQYTPLNLAGNNITYTELYGTSKKFMLLLSYEKNISSSFGLLAFEVGSGLMATTAQGFKEGGTTERSHEKLVFLLIPNHISLVYRFQYSTSPLFSPYLKGGFTAFGILESPQSSGAKIKLGLAPAAHMAAGLGINIFNWSSSKKELQDDYEMHSFFIFAEYKVYKSLSKKFNVSNRVASVGLSLGF